MKTKDNPQGKAQTDTKKLLASLHAFTSEDKLLTSKQVSEIVGKSEAWLVRKRWEGGGIPYRKIGRHVRYQYSVVLRWLNNQPTMRSTSDRV
jgi:predicted DNA-binding transcriptional regulator AlpA